MSRFLKQSFSRLNFFWMGIIFAVLFAAMRAVGILTPIRFGYLVPAGFVLMVLLPFIFLNRDGRKALGFAKSKDLKYYGVALVTGIAAALACYGIGILLFGTSADNWFITIKRFYENNPSYQPQLSTETLFLIFTIPAMIFSPFGEEIFFRGFLHLSLQEKYTQHKSKILDSMIFGIVHLCHHGIIINQGELKFYVLSGMVWVALMFGTALVFTWLKEKSQSIYPHSLTCSV